MTKLQDELKALQLCQSKVRAKKLPMEVIDAEYQWYAGISSFNLIPCIDCFFVGTAES
jgi:cell fate regulator YaaT (PSP1 superfamily)